MNILPICYFPTTVVLIDDNKIFLSNLNMALDSDRKYLTYSNAIEALKFCKESYHPDNFTKRFAEEIYGEGYQSRAINFNISDLYKEIYNPNRFAQISCVIVDYDMPGVNGLEICAAITDPNIKKILLTGAADEHLAVKAFNQGLISHFISKTDIDAINKVNQAIIEAEKSYFNSLSSMVANLIISDNPYTVLADSAFRELFYNIIKKHNIVEHYLFEEYGCFLMVDKDGNCYRLFIYPEADIEEIAIEEEKKGILDKATINELKNKKLMLCFHCGDKESIDIKDLKPFLHPAQKLVCKSGSYCYTLINENMNIDKDKILSFNNYYNLTR
ncbi:response regulator transcription factor [Rickettsiales endosymbiont of Stachyamoeba lipophora]|uniref:response regulator transcription factor n=1 Tax=Rickettsiales endosymbiont of Stachyamoeba lipophora TaxID=2486578 RepID=UPI000F648666|nr:response regulator [Rickettsiales endosymbiont of Stachyamoeba lipophora]AZL16102.1 response regulator [Rickettsiales endosymbiont of Stachyamoeba lipophora]